uniref:Putative secreted protein n=1 Tax=Ixodes scapularis TaxID=6945 RepID=A0A4D5S078_IXOSC
MKCLAHSFFLCTLSHLFLICTLSHISHLQSRRAFLCSLCESLGKVVTCICVCDLDHTWDRQLCQSFAITILAHRTTYV